jgi:Ribbon-helix-helix protein, copG family
MVYGDILIAMEKTTLYLPSELRQALKEAARSEKTAQAVVIRRALEEYLERRERPRLLSVGVGEDRELFGSESEDWLRAEWGKP